MRLHKIDSALLCPGQMQFNNSVCVWRGKRLMAYRLENRTSKSWAQIAICELDENWQPITGTNKILEIPVPCHGSNLFEDPRLYVSGDKLSLTFITARFDGKRHVACQCISHDFNPANNRVRYLIHNIGNNINYAAVGDASKLSGEKNWTLLPDLAGIIYQLNPLIVYRNEQKVSQTKADTSWVLGRWSGSTPLIAWQDNWLGCFHSFNYGNDGHRSYYAGWYILSKDEKCILGYSRTPILEGKYDEDEKRPFGSNWIPRAVFPCGLIDLGEEIALSYGWLDSTCRMAFFTRTEITANLTPVSKWYEYREVLHNPWGGIPGGFGCKIGEVEIKARNWPMAVRKAREKQISENELMRVLCLRVPSQYKSFSWVEA